MVLVLYLPYSDSRSTVLFLASKYLQYCSDRYPAHRATITSANENDFLANELLVPASIASAYIGLDDRDQNGSYLWVAGEEVTYGQTMLSLFLSGYCIDLLPNGSWFPYFCGFTSYAMYEYDCPSD